MKTLVIGASLDESRYSNRAIKSLISSGHEVVAIGKQEGMVETVPIYTDNPIIENLHTVTLYLSPKNQLPYYSYILGLKPKRIIFNPGTENPDLEEMARKNNIESIEACTLVMLATRMY